MTIKLPPIDRDGPLMRKLHREWRALGIPFLHYARSIGVPQNTLRERMERHGLNCRKDSRPKKPKRCEMQAWERIRHVEATELRRRIIIAEHGEEGLKWMR